MNAAVPESQILSYAVGHLLMGLAGEFHPEFKGVMIEWLRQIKLHGSGDLCMSELGGDMLF